MVRIVHTADVHLDPSAPERLDAFEVVLFEAKTRNADAVTIGGDLFDSELAAEEIRPTLRRYCSEVDIPLLCIPGNHDSAAFDGNRFFGDGFTPLLEKPFCQRTIGDLRITALPYTDRLDDNLLVALRERDPHDGPEALLFHCSLEAPIAGESGDEGAIRYCPVRTATLVDLGFEYYLAGHYHSPHLTAIEHGQQFTYPGSPASITRGETGKRTIAILDTAESPAVRLESIETFRYRKERIQVSPGAEESALGTVAEIAEAATEDTVAASVSVGGLIQWDEARFERALSPYDDALTIENTTRTVEDVTSHPLWESVTAHLETIDTAEQRAETERFILECMASTAAEGNLR